MAKITMKELQDKIIQLENRINNQSISIIESKRQGNQWYRKYSDGYIEQGGLLSVPNDTRDFLITFLKPFTSTGYCVNITSTWIGSTSGGWDYVHSKTVSSCKATTQAGAVNYFACGY